MKNPHDMPQEALFSPQNPVAESAPRVPLLQQERILQC